MCYDERRTENQIKTSELLKIFTKNDYTALKSQLKLLHHYDVMELKKRQIKSIAMLVMTLLKDKTARNSQQNYKITDGVQKEVNFFLIDERNAMIKE